MTEFLGRAGSENDEGYQKKGGGRRYNLGDKDQGVTLLSCFLVFGYKVGNEYCFVLTLNQK